MKKIFVIPLALALITPIKVNAKEFKAIIYDGASYVTHNKDNKAYLPLRNLAESMAYKVTWNGKDNSINLDKKDIKITLKIGSDEVTYNGEKIKLNEKVKVAYESSCIRTFVSDDFVEKVFNLESHVIKDGNGESLVIGKIEDYEKDLKENDFGVVTLTYKATKENDSKNYELIRSLVDTYSPDKILKERHIHKFYKANKDDADYYMISWNLNGKLGSKVDISLKDGKLDTYSYDIRDAKLEKKDSFTEKDATTLANEFYKKYINKDGELKISKKDDKNKSIEFKGSEGSLIYVDIEYGHINKVTASTKL